MVSWTYVWYTGRMKGIGIFRIVWGVALVVGIGGAGFVRAAETCTVAKDDDADYKSIAKALEKDCTEIRVQEGAYSDAITIGKDVTVRGADKKKVTISGDVTMKDGAHLRGVTVTASHGVTAAQRARVKITDVVINGAKIGVTAAGGGGVTMDDVTIRGGGKGMYMQFGTRVAIKNCTVENNKEEGIDLRANTDGSITGCTIASNGESGIEVILGRSNLTISGNTIKKNKASGIATQFYPETKKEGDVRITKNTISGNSHFGVNCKRPIGGTASAGYWDNSLTMTGNTISGNKDGDFSEACKLADQTMAHATMTKTEIAEAAALQAQQEQQRQEALRVAAEEKKKVAQQKAADAQARAEEEKRQKEEEERQKKQQEHDAQAVADVEARLGEIAALQETTRVLQERVASRPAWKVFFVGVDTSATGQIAESVLQQNQKIREVHDVIATIGDVAQRESFAPRIDNHASIAGESDDFLAIQKGRFSLFGWMKK